MRPETLNQSQYSTTAPSSIDTESSVAAQVGFIDANVKQVFEHLCAIESKLGLAYDVASVGAPQGVAPGLLGNLKDNVSQMQDIAHRMGRISAAL